MIPIPVVCEGGFSFTSKAGNPFYRVKLNISDEKGKFMKVNKVFEEDYSFGSELRDFLDGLGVISEDGDFDDASLIGKEFEVILNTGMFNDKEQRNVDQIIL